MKSTFATSVLRQSPSSAHPLRPSCRLVWSNSCYFTQNCTISTMQILLHSGRHDWMRRSWEFGECKFIFIAINPPFVNLNILMMGASFRFICLASCMVLHQVGQIILHSANTSHELFMWALLLLKHRTTQQSTQFVDCCIMPICHYEKWKCIRRSTMCGLDMIVVVANIIKYCFRQNDNQPSIRCHVLPLLICLMLLCRSK